MGPVVHVRVHYLTFCNIINRLRMFVHLWETWRYENGRNIHNMQKNNKYPRYIAFVIQCRE